ncbi:MAG: hypothetical protein ACE5KM_06470 [Planctomycetaceae bacterium]
MSGNALLIDDSPEDVEREIYNDRWVRIVREGSQIIFESRATSRLGFQLFAGGLFLSCIVGTLYMWFLFFALGRPVWLLIAGASTFGCFCGLWTFAQTLFARRFSFDFDSQICRFQNIPGMGVSIPFDRIEAFDVLIQRFGGITLGLAHSGKTRRLRMHFFYYTRKEMETIEHQTELLANSLSKLIDRPVRVIRNASARWNSWI